MKKRFLFVFYTIKGGGAEKVAIQIANNIVDKTPNEVHFFIYDDSDFYKNIINNRIKIIQANKTVSSKSNSNFYFNVFVRFGLKLSKIKFNNYNYIIAVHEIIPELALIQNFLIKIFFYAKLRRKLILWFHSNNMTVKRSNLRRKIFHFTIKNLRKIVFIKFISNSLNIKNDFNYLQNIYIVNNPIDIKYINETALVAPHEKNTYLKKEYYLVAAKITWDKNQILLLKAFNLIKDHIKENIVLIGFIQDSVYYLEIKKFILENSLEDRVFILGMSQNPYYYIKNSKALISTSVYESFSMAIHEAMALKKITVVTKYPGYEEFFNDGNSIIVEQDEIELSKTLLDISCGKINVEKIVDNAYLYVQKYSVEGSTEQFLKIFD